VKEVVTVATKSEKAALVDEISVLMKNASISIVSGYKDLSVADQQELRDRIRETGAIFRVVKNSLAMRAAGDAEMDGLGPMLVGQSAFTFGSEDVPSAARALRDFAVDHPSLDIRGAMFEGQVLDAMSVLRLASILGRDQLNAELVWTLDSPISGFVHVLDGLINGLVYALQGRVDQLGATEAQGV
jgi:large subunit ribosomal protein L10